MFNVVQICVTLPQQQENKENALNHASSFSCRSRNTGNRVQRKGKRGKEESTKGKCNQGVTIRSVVRS